MRGGACCTFDRFTLHRTQPLAHPTSGRQAVEFRITSRSLPPRNNPGDQHPFMSTLEGREVKIQEVGVL